MPRIWDNFPGNTVVTEGSYIFSLPKYMCFHCTITLDNTLVGWDASKIVEDVIVHPFIWQ
jgi:hypothetical protein